MEIGCAESASLKDTVSTDKLRKTAIKRTSVSGAG
jgi:hypothetical protein